MKRTRSADQKMGVDPYHGWQANYQILPGKEKVVAELQKLAKDADSVYLATDLDREEKPSLGTFVRSSVAMKSDINEWYLTKSPKTPFSRLLSSLVN